MPQALPRVSVIIPTKNRPSDLELVVKTIFKQSVTPQELIIVDQSESDDAKEQVEKEYAAASRAIRDCLKLCYFRDESIMGVNDARNRAMEIAAGDVWLFLDDDVELEPTFLEELLVVYLRFPHVGGVSGIITNYRPPSWAFRIWTWLFARGPFHDERQPIYWKADRLRESDPIPVSKFGSGLMSFRAEVLRGLRFDSSLNRALGEDVDFCARLKLGTALVITPRARLIHKRSLTARSEQHWLQRYAQACQYLYRRYWRRGIKNRLCFAWVNLGCALVATLAILRRRSLDPWRALAAGIREGRKAALDVR